VLTLCVLLWAVPGNEDLLAEYEDQVLERLAGYGARVVNRVRATGTGDGPREVQILEFPSAAELAGYLADPARVALAGMRDRAIARTELIEVEPAC
jgi:uncharacterized protein (DUF1330 family)